MHNRVDYLSDKLVHLRGKLTPVNELLASGSANGSDAGSSEKSPASPSSDVRTQQALQLRREQTEQLFWDLKQRIQRRQAQLNALRKARQQEAELIRGLDQALAEKLAQIENTRLPDAQTLNAVALGECFREIDRQRIAFFADDAQCEFLLAQRGSGNGDFNEDSQEESFSVLLRKGWAMAITIGGVIAAAILIAAIIIFSAWR